MRARLRIAFWLGCGRGRKRWAGAFVAAGMVMAGIAVADTKPNTANIGIETIEVTARAIESFERSGIVHRRYGKLEWQGGLELTSTSENFGGWSGLAVDAKGETLVAVSDAGTWLTASIIRDGQRPKGLANVRLGPLEALGGKPLRRSRDRDAEALAVVEGDVTRGRLLIAFEQNHRIGVFDITAGGISPPKSYLSLPADAQRMRALKGIEAMAVLKGGPRKGTVVAIAERNPDRVENHRGWLLSRGKAETFTLTDIAGHDITDAASLADGSLLVLERRFRWLEGVKMRVRYIKAHDIKPGARIEGEVLLEANMGQEIDNMEALAVHTSAGGETVLTIMSDDNFNKVLQRTLLLQFAIKADDLASLAR